MRMSVVLGFFNGCIDRQNETAEFVPLSRPLLELEAISANVL